MNLEEAYFTISQVAEKLHRTEHSTRRLVKREIGFVRDGKQMLIPESNLKKYLGDHFIEKRKGL